MNKFMVLKNKRYILFLGRVVPEKRVDLLLSVIKSLEASYPDLLLVIAGPIENEKIIIPYKKNNNIFFYGPVWGEEKRLLISHSFIFCLPSDIEGFSVSLLEAMSQKCLCLVSDIQANKEVMGDCGLYFKKGSLIDLENKIKSVLCNPANYSALREDAYNRVKQNFTWDVLSEKMIDFYKECK